VRRPKTALAALVCRPRANQILYLGVLSPHHRCRAEITPDPPPAEKPTCARPIATRPSRRQHARRPTTAGPSSCNAVC